MKKHLKITSDNMDILKAITEDIKKDRNKEYWAKEWQEKWYWSEENGGWLVTITME